MRFTVSHEFDAPLDAVELALLTPELHRRLQRALARIESIEQLEHQLDGNVLHRVWRYRADAPIPAFARAAVTRDMLAWTETSDYDRAAHASRWVIDVPIKPEWRRLFRSDGTYRLDALPGGRTRRTVEGVVEIDVALVGALGERLIIAEVKKTFDAEGETVREMATVR